MGGRGVGGSALQKDERSDSAHVCHVFQVDVQCPVERGEEYSQISQVIQ